MLLRNVRMRQDRLTQTDSLANSIATSLSLPSITFFNPFSSEFLLVRASTQGLIFGPSSSYVTSPSLPIYQPYLILQGATKGKQNRFPPFLSCPPLITLPSLVLLFTTRDMPPRTFPKFLEIWLQEPAPRARNATAACVQKGSLCVHTCRQTHTHSSLERPVIRLCFDLDTHREESTNDYTHTGGCSFVLWYVHQRHSLSCVPLWSTHWPLYTLHTPIAHLSVQPSQIFRKSPEVFRSHWSLCQSQKQGHMVSYDLGAAESGIYLLPCQVRGWVDISECFQH